MEGEGGAGGPGRFGTAETQDNQKDSRKLQLRKQLTYKCCEYLGIRFCLFSSSFEELGTLQHSHIVR